MKFIRLLISNLCTKKMYQCGFPKYSIRETLHMSTINISSPEMQRFLLGISQVGEDERVTVRCVTCLKLGILVLRRLSEDTCSAAITGHKCPAGGGQVVPQLSGSYFSVIILTYFPFFSSSNSPLPTLFPTLNAIENSGDQKVN